MDRRQINNPLHGVTLEVIVTRLYEHYGWEELGELIPINCFRINPSVRSSLTYLRRTQWVRTQVEELYVATFWKPPEEE
jgi:uncharacterized protein (DUF2132 family)